MHSEESIILEQEATQNYEEAIVAYRNFPYFVFNEFDINVNENYRKEIMAINKYYSIYEKGSKPIIEGTGGDYIASKDRYKKIKILIDKEARFMFSQQPDIIPMLVGTDERTKQIKDQYQELIDIVLEKCKFKSNLLKSSKDCFIGKRIALLTEVTKLEGIKIEFFNSLEFYYEYYKGTNVLKRFISFKCVTDDEETLDREYIVNEYLNIDNKIFVSKYLYDSNGNVLETYTNKQLMQIDYIPVSIIINEGTLRHKKGISEVEDLMQEESSYSRLANADIDSLRKGMNPVLYVIDMSHRSTSNLSRGAGAFWDLSHDSNMNDPVPQVGVLAPPLNHTEPLKVTLDRIENTMYSQLDIPNINSETLAGVITSGKTIEALYYPLTVRCNEKMIMWEDALKQMTSTIINFALLNNDFVSGFYGIENLQEEKYKIKVEANYALLKNELEEKESDLAEVNSNAMSKKSYIKKWRTDIETDEQIEEELIQIATEINMFDVGGMNAQVQSEIEDNQTESEVEENLEAMETNETIKQNKNISENL